MKLVHGKLLLRRKMERRPSADRLSRNSSLTVKWRRTSKGCAGRARRICSSTSNSLGDGGGNIGSSGFDGTAGFWRPRAVMHGWQGFPSTLLRDP